MIRGYATRSRIANGAGYPPAFLGTGNDSQGLVLASTGFEDPAGYQFAAGQSDFGYNDSDPFGSNNGVVQASGIAVDTAEGFNGYAPIGGVTTANQTVSPLNSPYGVFPDSSDIFGGGRTHAVSGATLASEQPSWFSQYGPYILGIIAVAAVAYYVIRKSRGKAVSLPLGL